MASDTSAPTNGTEIENKLDLILDAVKSRFDHSSTIRKLMERIECLEEDIVDLRTVVGGMALEVVTHRVRVVDDQDRDRVRLDADGTAFAVTGPDGVERVSLRCIEADVDRLRRRGDHPRTRTARSAARRRAGGPG